MSLAHWFHHLINPHCPLCQEQDEEKKVCSSCETLKMQLAIANDEKRQMLNTILSFSKPAENQSSPPVDYEKVKPKVMTWNVRRQMLEAEDRKAAQVLAEERRKTEIEKLEKETGISEEVKPGA
jgi:hypothetical protein